MKKYPSYNYQMLLELLSKNDQFALTEILKRSWKKLFATACNKLKENQVAEILMNGGVHGYLQTKVFLGRLHGVLK